MRTPYQQYILTIQIKCLLNIIESIKKLLPLLFLILTSYYSFGQFHHQMLSSQGSTLKTKSGLVVTQTVGQQSVIGNYSNTKFKVGYGYQQAVWNILIQDNPKGLTAFIFPNPFVDEININLSNFSDNSNLKLYLFDVTGKEVFRNSILLESDRCIQNLESLPSGAYLVLLKNNFNTFYAKLIKK